MIPRVIVLCAVLLIAQDTIPITAQGNSAISSTTHWPGLWGPSRNGTASGSIDASRSQPEVLWRRPVGGGYSEVAIHLGRAYTMELHDGVDYIVALDAMTGRELWRVPVGPTYRGHGGSDDGPISTPAVDADDLFALGPHGHLIAVDTKSGKERWRHDLVKAFGASAPTWGFAASPLIEGRLVIVPTGGPKSQGLLAFDRATGRLVWNAAVAKATGYSSAVSAVIGGVRQVVVVAGDAIFAVTPGEGRVLWTVPGPRGNIEISNSAILLPGNRLLVSNWEESMLLAIEARQGAFAARELWRSPRLRNSNGPTVHRDGLLYGFAGSILVCVNAETTEVVWQERTGPGTLILVGDQLVLLGQSSGELLIAGVSGKGFVLRNRVRVLDAATRAVTGPSFADGRLYVRNLKEIVALRFN